MKQKKFNREKNYIYINIVLLMLSIYVILFPIIIMPITKIIPSLGICPYFRLTGNLCPLCGGTRYISGIFKIFKDPTYLINPFGIIILVVIFEIIFRIWLLIQKNYSKKNVVFDFYYHLIIVILFFLYEILFFIK